MAVVAASVLATLAMLWSASSDKQTRGWSGTSRELQMEENGPGGKGRQ
jgi:hypothetical protein